MAKLLRLDLVYVCKSCEQVIFDIFVLKKNIKIV